MSKHFSAQIIGRALEMREKGCTHQQIGEKLGYSARQIQQLLWRHDDKQYRDSGVPRVLEKPRFGAQIIGRVLELKDNDYTNRQIGEKLGYSAIQIKKLLGRYYKDLGVKRPVGRPRKRLPVYIKETNVHEGR